MRADYGNQRPGFRFSHTPSVFDQHPRLSSPTVAGDPLVRGDLADLVATIRTFLPAFVSGPRGSRATCGPVGRSFYLEPPKWHPQWPGARCGGFYATHRETTVYGA